jgi:phosphate transport system permease protein
VVSLGVLLVSIAWRGLGAFLTTEIRLEVDLSPAALGMPEGIPREEHSTALAGADPRSVLKDALRSLFPEVSGRSELRDLSSLVSRGAGRVLEEQLAEHPDWIGRTVEVWLPADDEVDLQREGSLGEGRISPDKAGWIDTLERQGRLRTTLNARFLTSGDSRERRPRIIRL